MYSFTGEDITKWLKVCSMSLIDAPDCGVEKIDIVRCNYEKRCQSALKLSNLKMKAEENGGKPDVP